MDVCPPVQFLQIGAAAEEKVLILQSVQLPAIASELAPARQFKQVALKPVEDVPAKHAIHVPFTRPYPGEL